MKKNKESNDVSIVIFLIVVVFYPMIYLFITFLTDIEEMLPSTRDFFLTMMFEALPYLVIFGFLFLLMATLGVEDYIKSRVLKSK